MANNYGIKAYGTAHTFADRSEYEAYLNEWIAGTDGAEQERAITALCNLHCGIPFTDTDIL